MTQIDKTLADKTLANKTLADNTTEKPQTLAFEDDRGASRSTWVAAAILVVMIAWMGSGFVVPSGDEAAEDTGISQPDAVAVAVRRSVAQPVTLFFQAEGQAQPDRDTAMRAEASGNVAEVMVSKGQDVAKGEIIARLTTQQVEAELRGAQQEEERARREFENAEALLERGVSTADRVAQARATLAAAQAQVEAARQALESTNIVAPFAGRIETLLLDEGEFISEGTDVGRIVDNRPLTVALQVPQQALNRIENGQIANVTFITGEEREGTVTFVGTSAAAETRTFLAEIEVANEDGAIPAGISAKIRIPTGTQAAHFISPSVVSLNPDGEIGVKSVAAGKVVFHEVEVARAEVDGIWVTGLPDEVQIITIGQGFVRDGEAVSARPETNAADADDLARTATE